jgi:hypothetical protein
MSIDKTIGPGVNGAAVASAVDPITQSIRMQEANPLDTRALPQKLELENITAAVHDYYFDIKGKPWQSIIFDFAAALGVGITVWLSNQDDGTAPASCFYLDKSSIYGSVGGWNADGEAVNTDPENHKYMRVRVDNTGGAGTEDVDIFLMFAAIT